MNECFLFFVLPQREKNNYMSPQCKTVQASLEIAQKQQETGLTSEPYLQMHMISMPGKKKGERLILQSPPYPCNYPLGQLNLPENKVKHYTCTESAGVIDNDSDRNSRAFMFMLNCTRPATNENHWRIGCSQGTMNSCERWSMCVFAIFAYMCVCSSITLLSINYILQGT